MKKSAGLLIIQNKKILLAHPTNASWEHTFSIPKGNIEKDETNIDAAIRETLEEVGIEINEKIIDTTEYFIDYVNKKGKVYKKVFYYIVNIDDNIYPETFNKDMLQLEEVDWAGFLDIKDAKDKIFWRFKQMLDFIDE